MKNSIDDLRKACQGFATKLSTNTYNDLLSSFKQLLDTMARNGLVDIGEDTKLTSDALELRVKMLFEHAGMGVLDGRSGMEDLVIKPPENSGHYIPLVIEVKSRDKQSPLMDHLRQLDDYVFDLSGEKGVRKRGLSQWNKPKSQIGGMSIGACQPPHIHPDRHKGVFVFNGPIGMPFENRSKTWLESNQKQFVEDRGFCLMSLEALITWAEVCHGDGDLLNQFWQKIYEANGILDPFSERNN
ncbi:MAG: hypothetical protein ACYSUD_10950 [Planctomycetota bacterium]